MCCGRRRTRRRASCSRCPTRGWRPFVSSLRSARRVTSAAARWRCCSATRSRRSSSSLRPVHLTLPANALRQKRKRESCCCCFHATETVATVRGAAWPSLVQACLAGARSCCLPAFAGHHGGPIHPLSGAAGVLFASDLLRGADTASEQARAGPENSSHSKCSAALGCRELTTSFGYVVI